jgi:hypothetical protein
LSSNPARLECHFQRTRAWARARPSFKRAELEHTIYSSARIQARLINEPVLKSSNSTRLGSITSLRPKNKIMGLSFISFFFSFFFMVFILPHTHASIFFRDVLVARLKMHNFYITKIYFGETHAYRFRALIGFILIFFVFFCPWWLTRVFFFYTLLFFLSFILFLSSTKSYKR